MDCQAGSYKDTSMTECKLCPDNKISSIKAGICSECPQGTAANEQHTKCGNFKTDQENKNLDLV